MIHIPLEQRLVDHFGANNATFIHDDNLPKVRKRDIFSAQADVGKITGNFKYASRIVLGPPIERPNGHGNGHGNGNGNGNGETHSRTKNIIVPGYLSGNKSFLDILRTLEENGIPSSLVKAYSALQYPSLSTAEATAYLQKKIERSDADRLNIIAHSMGGIVALKACANLSDEMREKIGVIVALGTPWQGTYSAIPLGMLTSLLGINDQAVQELRPGSEVIRSIEGIQAMLKKKVLAFGTIGDSVVTPWQSSMLTSSGGKILLSGSAAVNHADLLHDPRVLQAVAMILKEYQLDEDEPSQQEQMYV